MSTIQPGIDVSICWQFPNIRPLEGLTKLQEFGYEGIELWPAYLEAFSIREWQDALEETGLRLFQICPYFNFMEGPEKIDASRAILHSSLAAARATGCKRIRVFTGPPWGQGVVGAKEATERQWSDALESLREFCDIAAVEGVELCLECHEGSLMEDSPNALRVIRSVQRPNLTVNLQIPFVGETWGESVESLGPYVTHIHIHNWTGGIGVGDLTYLATGKFDWRPVITTLVGRFNRHVTLSAEHIDHLGKDDPWETAERDAPYLISLRG